MLYSSISHCLHFYYFRIRNSWIWCNNARHFKIHIQFSRPSILISKLNNLVQRLSTAWNKKTKKQFNCLVWFADNKFLFVSPFLHLHFSLQPKRQMYKDSYHPQFYKHLRPIFIFIEVQKLFYLFIASFRCFLIFFCFFILGKNKIMLQQPS